MGIVYAVKMKARQIKYPIAQQVEGVARANVRLLNCWLGIASGEKIGVKFCVGCEYITVCKSMFLMLGGSRNWHPAQLARKVFRDFGIDSEYVGGEEGE